MRKRKLSIIVCMLILISTTLLIAAPSTVKSIDLPLSAPSYLRVGDLMFIESKHELGLEDLPGWDHVVMYIGADFFVEACPYPGWKKVQTTQILAYQYWVKDIAFGYVKTASETQRLQAVGFAMSQLGRPYQDAYECWWANANPDDPDDPYSDWWYCSELVWASYLNQGINIDVAPFPLPPKEGGDGIHLYVAPQDIADDDDVEIYTGGDPPYPPSKPSGPTSVKRLQTRLYSTSAIDPEGDDVILSVGLG